jgi:hypothetical protein
MTRKRPLSPLSTLLGSKNDSSGLMAEERQNHEEEEEEVMDSASDDAEPASLSSSSPGPAAIVDVVKEDLHRSLVSAIFDAGVLIASPTKIAEHMHLLLEYPRLKTENIKSHLQRFRKTIDVGKIKFMDEYDRFLERVRVVHHHNTIPGAFGMVDLRHVLGGKSAALMTYSVMEESRICSSNNEGVSPQGGDYHNSQKMPPPKGEILDYTFVHTISSSSGINVTKLPVPKLTAEEMETPVGKSFSQLFSLLKEMDRYLLHSRGIPTTTMPPPHHPVSNPSMVSLETLSRQQQQQKQTKRGALSSKSTMRNEGAKIPPTFSWYKHAHRKPHSHRHHHHKSRPRRHSRDLEKLRLLVTLMTNRRQQRGKLQRRNPLVTFSVPDDCHRDNVDDDSSSDSSSSSSSLPSFQGQMVPGRKASLDISTSTRSLSSPTPRTVDNNFSAVDADWIFEDIPKPEDLRRGTFFNMDSSSSSLSTDYTEQAPQDNEVTVNNAAGRNMTVERQTGYQRVRSYSDVSAIGRDDETEALFAAAIAAADGGFTHGERSKSNRGYLPSLSEERQYSDMDTPFSPPSPSPADMMNYMETNVFDDNPEVASLTAREPNWTDFSGFSRSASPQQQSHRIDQLSRPPVFSQEGYPQARYTTAYSSHAIVHYSPSEASAVQPTPLAQPPTLAESEQMPSPQGSTLLSYLIQQQQQQQQQLQQQLQSQLHSTQYSTSHIPYATTLSMFEPPRPQLPSSPVVRLNAIPTPYNTPNDLSVLHPTPHHPPSQRYHPPLAASLNNIHHTNVTMSSSTNLPFYFPGLSREQPAQPLHLQQRNVHHRSSSTTTTTTTSSELGRFFPVDNWSEDTVADNGANNGNNNNNRHTT